MPVTPTIENVFPTVGASADTWGGILNERGGETYVDINALATLANANEAKANAALPKAGGTMTGDQVLADLGPGSVFSVGFRGLPVVSIDEDRTFSLSDAGKMIRLTGSTNRTWTIPPVGSVGFPVGTVIVLRSFSTGVLSIARGSGVQLRLDGASADANRSLASYGKCALVHEASNIWTVAGVGVA